MKVKAKCAAQAQPEPSSADPYISAIGHERLMWLYDPLIRWTVRERAFKHRLIEQAAAVNGEQILDLGCGTATLTLLLKRACPESMVIGLDGDPQILRIARAKTNKAGSGVQLNLGMAQALPFPDASFDRVFSSLLFHHLTHEGKIQALQEVYRVLRPNGKLHLADWGKPQNWLMHYAFKLVERGDGRENTEDNRAGRLPALFEAAGFQNVRTTGQYMTMFGTLHLFSGQKLNGTL